MRNDQSDCPDRTDEQLCRDAQQGSPEAEELLVTRYVRLVRACARPLFLAGGDSEDLIQEGMVGLLKAVRTYDQQRQARFRTYAEVCIRSRLLSAIRAAGRDKHSPLNNSIPFDSPLIDTAEYLSLHRESPEDVLIGKEEWKERLYLLKDQLSGFETKILQLYLSGLSYGEIANRIGRPQKSVDNAVQRIRRKVARQITSGESSYKADRK